ncbi:unnamed protein product [Nyctereutes procyonoides]|uniref:(raccoon dog) hypothetical protein n=1 Tax=Nyctereutes procyonoides TaxID=34880 RepID=A0A811Y8E0_NYCPR|nr:unnamed protein product [Nyctereutes procyonoides]
MGCPAGVGRSGPRGRAVTCPPPPPLLREFQSERARGLLLGRNHPARRRRVGRRHLTARPRPPRVRGGGSVCSVTNGPSRPARPLARARRGPARAGRAPPAGSRRPAAQPGAGQRSPPPLRAPPAAGAEARRRRSLREARPRRRAALPPAGTTHALWESSLNSSHTALYLMSTRWSDPQKQPQKSTCSPELPTSSV